MEYDVTIIGGGHNGLVTAAYLARSGRSVLVLERSGVLGGAAATLEAESGHRVPECAHLAAPIHEVVEDLGLVGLGLDMLPVDPVVSAPTPDGRMLSLHRDLEATVNEISAFSTADADRYPDHVAFLERIAPIARRFLTMTPPVPRFTGLRDALELAGAGFGVWRLSEKDLYELLRIVPMCIADYSGEWFETDILKAVISARGLIGTFAGPWSAGTTAVMLTSSALMSGRGARPVHPRGGMSRFVEVLERAARREGVDIRTEARVESIITDNGVARGVRLEDGELVHSRLVVSNADPVRTLDGMLEPGVLNPKVVRSLKAFRQRGTAAKVNLRVSELPDFLARPGKTPQPHHHGPIHIGPEVDYLERAFDAAKYGRPSEAPYLEMFIPTVVDPSLSSDDDHILSIYMQYAPYHLREGDWASKREALGDTVVETLARFAPNVPGSIRERWIVTPQDLEDRYALTGGHIHHGEPSLEQVFVMRPLPGFVRYRSPVRNLYLCGAGTHPGGGLTGACGYNAARQITADWGSEIL